MIVYRLKNIFTIFPYFSDKKIKINIFWAQFFFFFVYIIIKKRFYKKRKKRKKETELKTLL